MKKIILAGIAAMSLTITSCDSYLDINDSPNSPSGAALTTSSIFPGAETAFSNVYGDFYRITGGYFSQQYAQFFGTSNYVEYSQFEMSATRSSGSYTTLNQRCLSDLAIVAEKAEAEGDKGTLLAVAVIRAGAYQAMVDAYGEIPYSEALDITNPSPKYDDGKDIYAGLIEELITAKQGVSASDLVCTNFLFPSLTADGWIKAANALLLRLYMRESGAVDVKSAVAALIAEDNFPTSDVCWEGCWADAEGKANPFYTEDAFANYGGSQKNVILNVALSETMDKSNDPRMGAWFETNADGEFIGGVSGTNFSTASKIGMGAGSFCRPKMKYNSPVYFITVAEINFFLAEYYAMTGNAGSAKQYYEDAIKASFATAGVDGAESVIAAYPWESSNYKKNLGIQKWVALSGVNPYEAWCEMRRLGYPTFGTATGAEIYNDGGATVSYNPELLEPGTLYTPYQVFAKVGANRLLQRWPYPSSSTTRNKKAPEMKDDHVSTPIFWAK